MATFEEVWERDARWLSGPHILGQIIEHLRTRAIIVRQDEVDPSRLIVELPLPEVKNEVNGEMAPISWIIPEELRGIFFEKCNEILEYRVSDVAEIKQKYLCQALTPMTIAAINSDLLAMEHERNARGNNSLWAVAAARFGIYPSCEGLVLKVTC
jgi:hypothetical protein